MTNQNIMGIKPSVVYISEQKHLSRRNLNDDVFDGFSPWRLAFPSGIAMHNVIHEQHAQTAFLPAQTALAAIPEFPMSLSTLARLAAKGDFPAPVKVGGRSFWDPAAIAEWKAARILDSRTPSTKPQSKE